MTKINPKLIDEIFTDDVLDVLPSNDKIKHGAAMAKLATDPRWLARNAQGTEKMIANAQWHKDQKQRGAERKKNKTWKKNVSAASVETHGRPCVTPWGTFPSVQQAGLYRDKQRGTKCGVTVTCRNLKKGTAGYQYITREEYIILTGRDVV